MSEKHRTTEDTLIHDTLTAKTVRDDCPYDNAHGLPRRPAEEVAATLQRDRKSLEECGCCGGYHRTDWHGDCREDSERFTSEVADRAIELGVNVTDLEQQS